MENNKKRPGRPIPEWLKNLPKGSYSIDDLKNICDRSNSTIIETLLFNGAKKTYDIRPNGRSIAYYHWEGLKNE